MSQKSNHYFAHGVISIIIQGTHNMKIIYSPYGSNKPWQGYQYVVAVKILSSLFSFTLNFSFQVF